MQYDSVVCGGGPAGLLAAVAPACGSPPLPSDAAAWSDVGRFYLLGIGQRVELCGKFDDFVKHSVAVKGQQDWALGKGSGMERSR